MLPEIARAYADEGYALRLGSPRLLTSGVQPHAAPVHVPSRSDVPVTDWGFSIRDAWVFRLLADAFRPDAGLIIGNAFGVSAATIGAMFRPIALDVIDAECLGAASREGSELTRRIATRLDLDLHLVAGFSPRDLDATCRFDAYGLVFIDGEHTDAQLVADFEGVRDRLARSAAVVLHDVGLCGMHDGWAHVRREALVMGFSAHDLTFTDFGTTVLLRGLPGLAAMFDMTCGDLQARNERYHPGWGWPVPAPAERPVYLVPAGARIAFYGAGHDLEPYRSFLETHPGVVAAVLDDDPAKQGTTVAGVPVMASERLAELDVAAVIVSTRTGDLPVRARLARIAPELPVHPPAVTGVAPVELIVAVPVPAPTAAGASA